MAYDQESTAILISLIMTIVSSVCSAVNLVLIKVMKKWNGYIAVILHMCVMQMIYDAFFSVRTTGGGTAYQYTVTGIKFFSGISSTVWSNILVLTILRVITTGRTLDILSNFRLLFAIAIVPSLIFSSLAVIFSIQDGHSSFVLFSYVYYSTRILSITINFVAFTIIYLHTIRTKHSKPTLFNRIFYPDAIYVSINSTPQEVAIDILSRRMFYYPFVQALGRIGACIYEGMYGFDKYSGNSSETQFALACFYYLTAPSIGAGYLIIFLIMQPKAYKHFKSLIFECELESLMKKNNNYTSLQRPLVHDAEMNTEDEGASFFESLSNRSKSSDDDDDSFGSLYSMDENSLSK
jgi:hypothetical protein